MVVTAEVVTARGGGDGSGGGGCGGGGGGGGAHGGLEVVAVRQVHEVDFDERVHHRAHQLAPGPLVPRQLRRRRAQELEGLLEWRGH